MRFTLLAPSLLLALAACVPTNPKSDDVEDSATDTLGAPAEDEDNDGFLSHLAGGSDCDDEDASVNPAAQEVCDGVDNNCDGSVDDGLSSTYWADGDGDGFGAGEPLITCEAPGEGWATAEGDCDDADASAFPGADVACEDADKNCDGLADNIDGDADGFAGCEECDDTQSGTFPGAIETCDAVDQDCDGEIDE
ncbi:putative metal-binding motif-containing protein, partial [Myxococcota bacterium]|nr:putative metal-binding motif-containing protein [Myxococcota bacterium]